MSRFTPALIAITAALSTSPAWAQIQEVPEPGMFGIVAASAVAVFVATRLRSKK